MELFFFPFVLFEFVLYFSFEFETLDVLFFLTFFLDDGNLRLSYFREGDLFVFLDFLETGELLSSD